MINIIAILKNVAKVKKVEEIIGSNNEKMIDKEYVVKIRNWKN